MVENPYKVEPEILAKLGEIVAEWGYVEMMVGELVAFLVSADPALMYIITNNFSASTLSDWARTLLRVRSMPDDPPKEVTDILAEADELRAERNALVHGLWSPHTKGAATVQTLKWERAEVIKVEVVTLADLDDFLLRAMALRESLFDLRTRWGFPAIPE